MVAIAPAVTVSVIEAIDPKAGVRLKQILLVEVKPMATSLHHKPSPQSFLFLLLTGCLVGGQMLAGCQTASQRTSETGMDAMAPVAPQVAETESLSPSPPFDREIPQETPDLSQEDYNLIRDNPFQLVQTAPLSTFALDVDSGAYSNVRRFLNDGQLPPPMPCVLRN